MNVRRIDIEPEVPGILYTDRANFTLLGKAFHSTPTVHRSLEHAIQFVAANAGTIVVYDNPTIDNSPDVTLTVASLTELAYQPFCEELNQAVMKIVDEMTEILKLGGSQRCLLQGTIVEELSPVLMKAGLVKGATNATGV